MKNEKKKVTRVRKFLGGLALILALSSTGCGLNKKSEPITNPSVGIEESTDIVDELDDMINEFGAELDEEVPTESETQDDVKEDTTSNSEVEEDVVEEEKVEEDTQLNEDNKAVLEDEFAVPNIGDYQGYSIVVALSRAGYDSSFTARKELATKLGIEDYRGTAEQNLELLRLLRGYSEDLNNNNANNNTNNNNNQNTNTNDNSGNNHESDDHDDNHNPGHGGSTEEKHTEHKYDKKIKEVYESFEDGHRLVTVYQCTGCTKTKDVYGEKESHVFTNYTADKDGKTKTGTCKCGKTHTIEINHEHTLNGKTKTAYENKTANGHVLVVYDICETCGDLVEKSKTTVTHEGMPIDDYELKTSTVGDKVDDYNHNVIEKRKCKDCGEEYTVTVQKGHVMTGVDGTKHYEPNGDDTHKLVETYECKCSHTEEKTIVASASCSYEYNSEKDKDVCSVCKYEKTHKHKMSEKEHVGYEDCGDGINHKEKFKSTCTVNGCNHEEFTYGTPVAHVKSGSAISSEWKAEGSVHKLHEVYNCSDCEAHFSPSVLDSHDASWNAPVDKGDGKLVRTCSKCNLTDVKDLGDHANHPEPKYTYTYIDEDYCLKTTECTDPQCDYDFGEPVPVEHDLETTFVSTRKSHKKTVTCEHSCGYNHIEENLKHTYKSDCYEDLIAIQDVFGNKQGKFKCPDCKCEDVNFLDWVDIEPSMYQKKWDEINKNDQPTIENPSSIFGSSITTTYSLENDANIETYDLDEELNDEVKEEYNNDDVQIEEQVDEAQTQESDAIVDEMIEQIIQDINLENEELVEQEEVPAEEELVEQEDIPTEEEIVEQEEVPVEEEIVEQEEIPVEEELVEQEYVTTDDEIVETEDKEKGLSLGL